MQKIVFDDPYTFVPPYRGKFWSWAFRFYLPRFLRTNYGITGWTTHGIEHLRGSLKAGHGIILCPNHCRISDPMLTGVITMETPCHFYALASWHVFRQSRLETFIARRVGGFSIYREGFDRQALDTSVDIVAEAERPLVIFPEGSISFANDRLLPLMDGTSFIARAAAKRRARRHPDSRVVIHPVAFRYRHRSDPNTSLVPAIERLERMVFWQTLDNLPLIDRLRRLGRALLCAREIQVLGEARAGGLHSRIQRLLNDILQPMEREWLGQTRTGSISARVKDLRAAIVPDMSRGSVDRAERRRRWRLLTDLYYAQCLSLYPEGYLEDGRCGEASVDRLFETVERLEEDMTDRFEIRRDVHVDITIGEAIEVDPAQKKDRSGDPLMATLRQRLLDLLGIEDWWPPEPVTATDDSDDGDSADGASSDSDSPVGEAVVSDQA
ncbi:MAG: 1-acyl-sn-glycerol-3-phosphate acyltransferase [Planctomycetaceae bacterium]